MAAYKKKVSPPIPYCIIAQRGSLNYLKIINPRIGSLPYLEPNFHIDKPRFEASVEINWKNYKEKLVSVMTHNR